MPPEPFTRKNTQTAGPPRFSSWSIALREIASLSRDERAATASSSRIPLNAEDLTALRRFYNGVVITLKAARAKARDRNEVPPDYPPHTKDVQALIERLQSAGARQQT